MVLLLSLLAAVPKKIKGELDKIFVKMTVLRNMWTTLLSEVSL